MANRSIITAEIRGHAKFARARPKTVLDQEESESRVCKHCGSRRVVGIGKPGGVQRYRCRICSRTFMDNGATPGMRIDATLIGAALSMYYSGFTLREVRCRMRDVFGVEPSVSTAHEWIRRYTRIAIDHTRDILPVPSGTWIVLESVLEGAGDPLTCIDVFDHMSGFLLDFEVGRLGQTASADSLVDRLRSCTGIWPVLILHRRSAPLQTRRIESTRLGARPAESYPAGAGLGSGLTSRFWTATEARAQLLRRLSRSSTIDLAAQGWWVHHNFARGFGIREFATPAVVAGLDAPFHDWAEVVHLNPHDQMQYGVWRSGSFHRSLIKHSPATPRLVARGASPQRLTQRAGKERQ